MRDGKRCSGRRTRRGGFSVIELVVVILVVGVLSSLLLPAIHRSRAKARRIQCMSNLRQMGVALENFLGTHRSYPTGFYGVDRRNGPEFDFYSPHARLLPQLEQDALYNQLNFSLNHPPRPSDSQWNQKVALTSVSVFLCPDDGVVPSGTNYRGNMGVGPWILPFDRSPQSGTGVFFARSHLNAGAFYDGLSRTVAFSEKLQGDGGAGYSPESEYWYTREGRTWPDVETWKRLCASLNDLNPPHNSAVGTEWLTASTAHTLYNHGLLPNSPIPDCGAFPDHMPPYGLFAARSWHTGGVNVVMLDASAHFISEEIDLKVWRALGTRAGREVFSDNEF